MFWNEEIERVLLTHAELSPYYQIVVDRSATMPRLEVHSEVSDEFFRSVGGSLVADDGGDSPIRVQQLREQIEGSLQTVLSLHATFHLEAPGQAPRSEGKAVRVVEKK
jgi:phenylacetate-CoA ligase